MAVTRIDISKRSNFADGASFDGVGPYELLEGTAHFAVDPLNQRNQAITDLELAPRQVEVAARALIDERYMLEEDLELVVERASSKFDYFLGNVNGG